MPLKILAVDDNPEGLQSLEDLLLSKGYEVFTASSGTETLSLAEQHIPDLILLDINMPEPDGFEVTRIIRARPELRVIPIILLTARDEIKDIVKGLDLGADDYLNKPYDGAELIARIRAVLRTRDLALELDKERSRNREFKAQVTRDYEFKNIVGQSRAMQELFSVMTKVVDSEVPVLISGESGTGKEVVAKALHFNGPRKDKAFVAQNCSAFNDNLLESELFGHVRGAFTGAVKDKEGLFEAADGGTFFLDELGEMSPALQVKLLRVIQEGSFIPVGATKPKHVNVRILAATHRNLDEMVKKGTFREDLYYRLNVINLKLPTLRERHGDIPLLVAHFLSLYAKKSGKSEKKITHGSLELLEKYSWPGNIRQLENELQRSLVMAGNSGEITENELSPTVWSGVVQNIGTENNGEEANLKDALSQLEKNMIEAALKKSGGNKSEAARKLGISRSNLIAKTEAFGLDGEGDE